MSADKELLEFAAKAAGIELDWDIPPNARNPWRMTGQGNDRGPAAEWNPLTDDGDALRLAVKLKMDIIFDFDRVVVCYGDDAESVTEYFYDLPKQTDTYAASCRAIVRAAAEIGKTL